MLSLDHALRAQRADERGGTGQYGPGSEVAKRAHPRRWPAPRRAAGQHGDRLARVDDAPRRPAPACSGADRAEAGSVDELPTGVTSAWTDRDPARIVQKGIGDKDSRPAMLSWCEGLQEIHAGHAANTCYPTRAGQEQVFSGEGGIRTLERACAPYSLSRRVPSATRPPLRAGAADCRKSTGDRRPRRRLAAVPAAPLARSATSALRGGRGAVRLRRPRRDVVERRRRCWGGRRASRSASPRSRFAAAACCERILDRDQRFRGLLTFTLPETLWLAEQGFEDLLRRLPDRGSRRRSAELAALTAVATGGRRS